MATQYTLTSSFSAITEDKGTIQNIGTEAAELVSTTNATAGEGIVLLPGEKRTFNGSLSARSMGDASTDVNVVDFTEAGEGGEPYVLPYATPDVLGGIKLGDCFAIGDFDRVIVDTVSEFNDGLMLSDDKIKLDSLISIPNTAAAHNGIWRGNDITSYFDSLYMSIDLDRGDFSNIYIGDYITKSITINDTTYEDVKWIVMDLDYHLHCSINETTAHHVVLMPESVLGSAWRMNQNMTKTLGGYVGSAMFTTIISQVDAGIEAAFGSGHVLRHYESLSSGVGSNLASMAGAGFTGATNNWTWTEVKSNLANENMVYGSKVLSSSFYDVGDCKQQLAAFRLNPNLATIFGYGWWLRSIAKESYFCMVSNEGLASYEEENNLYGLRPYFLLY